MKSSKLRTYMLIKNKLKYEGYLDQEDRRVRREMSRLRSGTNNLRIEKGRYNGETREKRVCWSGCHAIEDEKHFLMECFMYNEMRKWIVIRLGSDKIVEDCLKESRKRLHHSDGIKRINNQIMSFGAGEIQTAMWILWRVKVTPSIHSQREAINQSLALKLMSGKG